MILSADTKRDERLRRRARCIRAAWLRTRGESKVEEAQRLLDLAGAAGHFDDCWTFDANRVTFSYDVERIVARATVLLGEDYSDVEAWFDVATDRLRTRAADWNDAAISAACREAA
jgi:hypothetical protein